MFYIFHSLVLINDMYSIQVYSYSKDGNWTVYDNEMLLDNGVRWVIIITDDENEDEEDIHNQENHST